MAESMFGSDSAQVKGLDATWSGEMSPQSLQGLFEGGQPQMGDWGGQFEGSMPSFEGSMGFKQEGQSPYGASDGHWGGDSPNGMPSFDGPMRDFSEGSTPWGGDFSSGDWGSSESHGKRDAWMQGSEGGDSAGFAEEEQEAASEETTSE